MSKLTKSTIIPFLNDIFDRRGADEYLGEPVTIGAHMLQAAHFARVDGHGDVVVAAALLHDIGHFTGEFIGMPLEWGTVFMEDNTDRQHENAGAAVLAPFFPDLIVDCCRHHVAAKRYLCARELARAQIPFRRDMMAAAIHNQIREEGGKDSSTGIFMLAVGIVLHEHRSPLQRHTDKFTGEMTDIVQQCRRHYHVTMPVDPREVRRLQHMRANRNRLTEIFVRPAPVEDVVQKGNNGGFGQFAHQAARLMPVYAKGGTRQGS